jgi:YD repeat-containing protein
VHKYSNFFDRSALVTTYDYDDHNRPPCRSLGFDAACDLNRFLVTKVTNPEVHSTNFVYDERGNLTSVTDALGNLTKFDPDPKRDGTVKAITRPRGGVTKFEYTYSAGNLKGITATDPLGRMSSVTFISAGLPDAVASASGKAAFFFFDTLGRKVKYQDGTQVTFNAYDGNNNLLSMTDSTGTTSFAYDHLNRVMQKSSPVGTVNYTYDAVGNLISKKDAGGTVTYEYDVLNRLMILTDHGSVVTYERYRPQRQAAQNHLPEHDDQPGLGWGWPRHPH